MKNVVGRALRLCLAAALISTSSSGALAWGAQGHQYVGNLAFLVLNPTARSQVTRLLGPNIDLGEAAVWADCVRSVEGSPTTSFRYDPDRFTPRACADYDDNGDEEGRITDYASRNWTNCEYSNRRAKCNLAYHFANVNVHDRTDYRLTHFGAGPQDVVQAIKAAIAVLRCPDGQTCTAPAPFNLRDKREALFLLAHFLGDVHQPLHVGAVYLDQNSAETGDSGRFTAGGNLLLLKPGEKGDNLHHEWDTVLQSIGTSPSQTAIASACRIAPRPDPVLEPMEDWASQSVAAARAAYRGMAYRPDPTLANYWDISFVNEPGYRRERKDVQARQLITAGARLGAVLNAIWPSKRRSAACAAANPRPARNRNR